MTVHHPGKTTILLGLLALLGWSGIGTAARAAVSVVLQSPGGRVHATIEMTPQKDLMHRMTRDGVSVLEDSPLGVTVDGVNLGSNVVSFTHTPATAFFETYPIRSAHTTAINYYNEMQLTFLRGTPGDGEFKMIFRAYDDGVAYRYIIPGTGNRTISGEATGWQFPAGSHVWYQTNIVNSESLYFNNDLGGFGDEISGPFTIKLPDGGGYALASEGALTNYSEMTGLSTLGSRLIRANFPYDESWVLPGGTLSPWRVTITSHDLNGMVNSDMITNLNPPPDPQLYPDGLATSYLKPGRATWSWFSEFFSGANYDIQVQFVDFAHQLGFEYCLVDAGWELGFTTTTQNQFQRLGSLVLHGKSDGRNVGIWVWKEWGELPDDGTINAFFQAVASLGVVGVKIDNLNSDPKSHHSHANIMKYVRILEIAAQYQLMIDFHGCSRNTGINRTWPNEMTRESLLGMEYNSVLWPYGYFLAPSYVAMVPFLRMVTGVADYTPLTLDIRKKGNTSLAFQIATVGIFQSPFMSIADHPASLLQHPEALDVIQAIPTYWDETYVMPESEIGEMAAYVRRKGERWFIFIMDGGATTTTQVLKDVNLSFMGTRTYSGIFLSDATSSTLAREEVFGVGRHLKLDVPLLPGGGFVAMLTPTSDTDGDGDLIPDGQDAAPEDPAVSSAVIYYNDEDGDQQGDPNLALPIETNIPFPGLVIWRSDPDDHDSSKILQTVLKGNRRLGLEFSDPAEDGAWRLDLARKLGVEATHQSLNWSAVETAPGVYDPGVGASLNTLNLHYDIEGLSLSLSVNPIDGGLLTVPNDLAAGLASGTLHWNDAQVINRFKQALSNIRQALPEVNLESLQIGRDIDLYLVTARAGMTNEYAAFFQAVAAHARQIWSASLKVGITATREGLVIEPTRILMQTLNIQTDFISVSYLPLTTDFTATNPMLVAQEIEQVLDLYPDRSLHLQSVGYPSSPVVKSSTTQQSQFFAAFFDTWDRHATRIPYVCFTRLNDLSEEHAAQQAAVLMDNTLAWQVKRAHALRSCGLRSHEGAGEEKSAFMTLRTLTFNRDWWRMKPPTRRNYYMGFTPQPFDQSLDGPLPPEVMDTIYGTFSTESDIVALNFDNGVPWVEALNDTFTTTTLPFSANVKEVWKTHRDRIKSGSRLAITINPLGVPRDLLAAYWGVGEGFYLDDAFKRVANGRMADFENRMLPAPWNDLTFNDPQVKQAYLNYCRRVIEYFHPDYLITGSEVNLLIQTDEVKFQQYVELQSYIYQALRANPAYAGTRILNSFTAENFMLDEFGIPLLAEAIIFPGLTRMLEQNITGLRALLPYMDIVGFSIYPIKTKHSADLIAASLFDNLFERIADETTKTLAITETGFPTSTFRVFGIPYKGDAIKQERFQRLLLTEAQNQANVEFVINFTLRDTTPAMDQLRAGSLLDPPYISPLLISFFQYFEHIGLYGADGTPKPADQVWRQFYGIRHKDYVPDSSVNDNWGLYQ